MTNTYPPNQSTYKSGTECGIAEFGITEFDDGSSTENLSGSPLLNQPRVINSH